MWIVKMISLSHLPSWVLPLWIKTREIQTKVRVIQHQVDFLGANWRKQLPFSWKPKENSQNAGNTWNIMKLVRNRIHMSTKHLQKAVLTTSDMKDVACVFLQLGIHFCCQLLQDFRLDLQLVNPLQGILPDANSQKYRLIFKNRCQKRTSKTSKTVVQKPIFHGFSMVFPKFLKQIINGTQFWTQFFPACHRFDPWPWPPDHYSLHPAPSWGRPRSPDVGWKTDLTNWPQRLDAKSFWDEVRVSSSWLWMFINVLKFWVRSRIIKLQRN